MAAVYVAFYVEILILLGSYPVFASESVHAVSLEAGQPGSPADILTCYLVSIQGRFS